MYEWIRDHQSFITPLMSIGTFLMWALYAQLLLSSSKRQRRARLLINRGAGRGLYSLCLFSNMSAEPVFINQIVFTLHTSEGARHCDVTDVRQDGDDEEAEIDLARATHQGPLKSGEFFHIGSFASLIRRTAAHHGIEIDQGLGSPDGLKFYAIQIRAVAYYGSENGAIGVVRSFDLEYDDDGRCQLRSRVHHTRQMSSWWRRRIVARRWQPEFDALD